MQQEHEYNTTVVSNPEEENHFSRTLSFEEENDVDDEEIAINNNNTNQNANDVVGGEWILSKFKRGNNLSNNGQPKLYKMRWVMLMIFTLSMFCSVLAQSTFSSVGTIMMKYYNVPNQNWKINMMTMIFLILSLPSSWTVSFVMKKYGLRRCVLIFGIMTCIGMWIRCLGYGKGSETNLWIAFIGQFLIAFAQNFVSNVSSLLSVNWFGDKERTLVLVSTLLMGVIGGGVSFAVGPYLITMGKSEMDGSEMGMLIYLIGQSVISTICLVLIVIFVKDKPPTPPVNIKKEDERMSQDSLEENLEETEEIPNETNEITQEESNSIENGSPNSSEEMQSDKKDIYPEQTFKEGVKKLLTSPHFIMLTIASSCLTSVFQTLQFLDQIITPKGYSTFDGAKFSLVNLVFVLIGSFSLSILFDKTKKFKLITCISCFMAVIGFGCFAVIMQWERSDFTLVIAYLSFVIIGGSAIPSLPLISQMLVYSTYPVHPATSLVISSAFGTCWSVVFLFIVNILQSQVREQSSNIILWMDFGLLIVVFLMILLLRGNFNNILVNLKNKS